MAGFTKVASVSEIPEGTGRAVEAGGVRIALFHVDGTFHAIDGTCPHRGGPLGEGVLSGRVVTCPWHFWRFDVCTGSAPDVPETRLRTYKVRIDGDDVLVDPEGETP